MGKKKKMFCEDKNRNLIVHERKDIVDLIKEDAETTVCFNIPNGYELVRAEGEPHMYIDPISGNGFMKVNLIKK